MNPQTQRVTNTIPVHFFEPADTKSNQTTSREHFFEPADTRSNQHHHGHISLNPQTQRATDIVAGIFFWTRKLKKHPPPSRVYPTNKEGTSNFHTLAGILLCTRRHGRDNIYDVILHLRGCIFFEPANKEKRFLILIHPTTISNKSSTDFANQKSLINFVLSRVRSWQTYLLVKVFR